MNRSLANTVTLLNIIFGSLSLLYTLNENYQMAAILILLAVIMDALDGRVARRLDIMSELGKQLDSLCDLVSFGVAPSLLVYSQTLYSFNYDIGKMLFLLFIICGTFRLARFNILTIQDYFIGIPITLAGTIMAFMSLRMNVIPAGLAGIVTLTLSILMVSNIKIKKIR